eukprot:190999_1
MASSKIMASSKKYKKFPLKAMQINFHRAGTTSTARALNMLNLGKTWHTALNAEDHGPFASRSTLQYWVDNKIDLKIINNEEDAFEKFNNWLNIIQCPIIMDAPTSLHWKTIFKWYPNCKIILCVRDFDKWHQSILRNIQGIFFTKWYKFFASFLPLIGWLHWYLIELTKTWDINNKENCKKFFYEYIENVKEIVPSNQLLIYNVKDEWDPLVKFFDVTKPSIPFPHTNDGPSLKRKVQIAVVAELILTLFPYIVVIMIAVVIYQILF